MTREHCRYVRSITKLVNSSLFAVSRRSLSFAILLSILTLVSRANAQTSGQTTVSGAKTLAPNTVFYAPPPPSGSGAPGSTTTSGQTGVGSSGSGQTSVGSPITGQTNVGSSGQTGVTGSPTQDFTYNPNHFDAVKIIEAMKTPHSDLTILSAHRGLHATPRDNPYVPGVPENSLSSVGAAALAGLELLELDFHLTQDGKLVSTHDSSWGRQAIDTRTNLRFNPFSTYDNPTNLATNPKITDMTLSDTQAYLRLRDSVSFLDPTSPEPPPSLVDLVNYYNQHQIGAVLALDIKDDASFREAITELRALPPDFLGRSIFQDIVFKIGGKLYPTPDALKQVFQELALEPGMVNYWPNYNTSDIDPSVFGSETAMIQSLESFYSDPTLSVVSAEITQKQPGGILDSMRGYFQSTGQSTAQFSPFGDYFFYQSDPDLTNPYFYYSNKGPGGNFYSGLCCVQLSQFLYTNPNPTQPSDTADDRPNQTFTLSLDFNIITTDDVLHYQQTLASQNKRNLTYMQISSSGIQPPLGFTYCSPADGSLCSFTGSRTILFGADGTFTSTTATNSIACVASSFPKDPLPKVPEACFYSNPIISDGFTYCADEGGTCTWNGAKGENRADFYFGTGQYHEIKAGLINGPAACDLSSFPGQTDPAPGQVKVCWFQPRAGDKFWFTAGWNWCASEGQTCYFAGTGSVKFQASEPYRTPSRSIVATNGVLCTIATFGGDPYPGVPKQCYYQDPTNSDNSNATGVSGTGTTGTTSASSLISVMQAVPQAVWLTDPSPTNAAATVTQTLSAANSQGAVPIFTLYNIPGRDCGGYSAGGAQNTADYITWIDAIAGAIGNQKAVVLVEPDSLADLPSDCKYPLSADVIAQKDEDRYGQIDGAITALEKQPATIVYIDAGNSHWQAVPEMAQRLVYAGVSNAQGFFSNVSNYNATEYEAHYDTWVSDCIAFGQNPDNQGWRLDHYAYCASQYDAQITNADGTVTKYTVDPTNIATWGYTDEWFTENMGTAVPTTHFVIDTSRNGQGRFDPSGLANAPYNQSPSVLAALEVGAWCNAPGRGLGVQTTATTSIPLLDAYFWVKTPGLSDGPCDAAGGTRAWDYTVYTLPSWPTDSTSQSTFDPLWGVYDPPAGQWFQPEAVDLINNANPQLTLPQ